MIPPIFVHCGFGLVLTLISVPLAQGRVPMNRLYGIRIPEAFASEQAWYRINAYGGRVLLVCGLLSIGFGLLARGAAPPADSPWMALFTVAPLLLPLLALPLILAFARRQ